MVAVSVETVTLIDIDVENKDHVKAIDFGAIMAYLLPKFNSKELN